MDGSLYCCYEHIYGCLIRTSRCTTIDECILEFLESLESLASTHINANSISEQLLYEKREVIQTYDDYDAIRYTFPYL